MDNPAAKTTKAGDTVTLRNFPVADTLVLYKLNGSNGYNNGMNTFGDMAFAERYDFNGADSSVSIIGMVTQFAGTVVAGSANTVQLTVWNLGKPLMVASNYFLSGFPDTVLNTLSVPVTELGIGSIKDTMKTFYFGDTIARLSGPFFAGYSMSYNSGNLAGDTVAILSTKNGVRNSSLYKIDTVYTATDTTIDTVIYVQNATKWNDNTWHDNYTQNDSLFSNLAIFPIVVTKNPTGIINITNNNLTVHRVFPNPCSGSVNFELELASGSDVALHISDIMGNTIYTEIVSNATVGKHTFSILLPMQIKSGSYLYKVSTTAGAQLAGLINVSK
jgi:hypothetical protein